MPEKSEKPVLKGDTKTLTTVSTQYETLLELEADPTKTLFVDSIEVAVNDITSLPHINVSLNGTPFLKDFPVLTSSIKFGFGRHWLIKKHKNVVEIQINKTAAGAGNLVASAWISGVEAH